MFRTAMIGAAAAACAVLAGCIVVVDDTGDMDSHWASSYEDHVDERMEEDRRLANRVRDELEFDDLLRHENIEVRAHGDIVSLHGRVADVELLQRAIELAASTEGVGTVRSRLTVEYKN